MTKTQPYKSISKYIFVYIILVLMLYYPTVAGLYKLWILDDWNVNRYSHGPLLLGMAMFLFYQRWSYLQKKGELNLHISIVGIFLLTLSSLAWFYFNTPLIRQILLILILCCFLFMVVGYRNTRKLVLPILLLVAAMPVWEFVNSGSLQNIAVVVVTRMLNVTGVTAYHDGFWIYVPAGSFFVGEYCSGIRQLMVAIPIALIYAYINWFKMTAVIIYSLMAALLSILVNIVRIYVVVVVGQITNMQHYLIQRDHETLGWMLFGVSMFLFFYASNKLIRHQSKYICCEGASEKLIQENDKGFFYRHKTFTIILAIVGASIGPGLNYIF